MAITTNTIAYDGTPVARSGYRPFAWTKSDTNFFEDPDNTDTQVVSRGLNVDTDGTYSLIVWDGTATASTATRNVDVYLAANIIHPIECLGVRSTGSAAGNVTVFQ